MSAATHPGNQAAAVVTELVPSTPVHRAFDSTIEPTGVPGSLPESNDRLVRHLFDIGLQLHSVRAVFERDSSTAEEIRAASDSVLTVLDDLDTLIRDAGLAMLDLAMQREPVRSNGATRVRRRRRG
ncbi:hypothetical protein [Nocardia transvalensis]|uniref:hypothetical protein n=1 Tax=Nocardia transvalensis TaxID=37333 RepID=UPI001893CB21|nr:hypothetical protein [Nocardia transvalensis]MBF6331568.1 hypothetical protein [Nocardia transvalensis]